MESRRRFKWFRLVFLLALSLSYGAARTQHLSLQNDSTRRELQHKYQQRVQAIKRKDINTLGRMLTPDFTYVGYAGAIMGSKWYLDIWQYGMESLAGTPISIKLINVVTHGKQAEVTIKQNWTKRTTSKKTGKVHKLAATEIFQETWVRAGKDWKLKRIKELSTMLTRDGKLLTHHVAQQKK